MLYQKKLPNWLLSNYTYVQSSGSYNENGEWSSGIEVQTVYRGVILPLRPEDSELIKDVNGLRIEEAYKLYTDTSAELEKHNYVYYGGAEYEIQKKANYLDNFSMRIYILRRVRRVTTV